MINEELKLGMIVADFTQEEFEIKFIDNDNNSIHLHSEKQSEKYFPSIEDNKLYKFTIRSIKNNFNLIK